MLRGCLLLDWEDRYCIRALGVSSARYGRRNCCRGVQGVRSISRRSGAVPGDADRLDELTVGSRVLSPVLPRSSEGA